MKTFSLPSCELSLAISKAAPAGFYKLMGNLWALGDSYYKNAPASELKNDKLSELSQDCDEVKMDIATSNAYVGYDKSVEEQKLQSDLSSFEQAMKQAGDNMGSAKGKFAGSAQ